MRKADASTTRKYGGTGLGLTISSRLVALMGGETAAERELERGTKIHFTTRLQRTTASPTTVKPVQPVYVQGTAVLIVDDNATNRLILEEMTPRCRKWMAWRPRPAFVKRKRRPGPIVAMTAHDEYSIGLALQQIAPYLRTGDPLPGSFAVPIAREERKPKLVASYANTKVAESAVGRDSKHKQD